MLKKISYVLTVLFVVFGMLAFTAPVSALSNKRALKGTIVALDTRSRTITVSPLKGADVKVRVAKGTIVTRKGKASSFTKLHVGDKVNLNYNPKNKQASHVEDSPSQYEIHGTVEAVDTVANTVTVASEEGGNSVILKVDANTVFKRNGVVATLADLLVGDKVEAKYDSATMLASSIKTETEDSDFNGTIAAVDLTAKTVTITPEDGGADVVLNVVESTVFISHDTVISLSNLQVGDKVEAEYDSATLVASKIELDD